MHNELQASKASALISFKWDGRKICSKCWQCAKVCMCSISTLVREITWTVIHSVQTFMTDEIVPLGRLTSWTPKDWKHPIGMPAGRSEGKTMSVIALV